MIDANIKILIVDDLPANLHAMEQTMQELGVKRYTALSGNEALVLLTEHEFAAVLLDVQMPKMDGFETALLMQKSKATRETPIIFVTAISTEEQHVFKGYQAGAVDYLFKPINPDILISKVKVFINLYRARTEIKLLMEEAHKAKTLESLGLLAGGIAHDFNNLLAVIFGNIEMAQMELADQDGKAAEFLRHSDNALQRATQLTRQLLTFSKGGGAPVKQQINIEELIETACPLLLSGSRCKLIIEIPESIYSVEIDPSQISQVLQNIIINAKEAMPAGGKIKVCAANMEIDQESEIPLPPGRYLKLTVTDSGPGIDSQIIDKIFVPYFSTKEMGVVKGQGLGLAICHSIVAKHGGWLQAESGAGTGASLHIYLPAAAGQIVTKTKQPAKTAAATDAGSAKGLILVMDDEEMLRNLLRHMLCRLGYDVLTASDGEEVIKLYLQTGNSARPVDCIIMDLIIPDAMGGEEAVKEVLKINPAAKVIVTSGYATDPILANYKEYGFCGALVKPFQLPMLRSKIAKALA